MRNIQLLEEIGFELDSETKRVLEILEKEPEVNEKFLAQALGTKINTVRKALYKLMHSGFVSYKKKRDKDKQWWYLYYWTLNPRRIKDVWVQHMKKELKKREGELKTEQGNEFECERGCKKFDYNEALESEFKCPYCDSGMVEVDTSEEVETLKKEIEEIEEELKQKVKDAEEGKPENS